MHRFTISIDDPLAGAVDAFLKKTGYRSRSEGLRDILRESMGRRNNDIVAHEFSVANLSYIYDRTVRRLASRLSDMQHAHHDLVVSASSVPLDHSSAFEAVMLKGRTKALHEFADAVQAQRGVRSLVFNLIGVDPGDRHEHAHDHRHTGRSHLSPTVS